MTQKELEQALTRLAEIEPTGVVAGLIYESEAEDTYLPALWPAYWLW